VSRLVLTMPQETMLVMIRWAGREGHSAPMRHPVIRALERRSLIEPRHCRSSERNRRWHATYDGREWVDTRVRD
jgi:hypothetical protein